MDKLSFFKEEQKLVADSLQRGLHRTFLKAATKSFVAELRGKGGMEPDMSAVKTFAKSEIDHDGLLAVQGYADWLASAMWKKTDFGRNKPETMALPDCAPEDRKKIAKHYGINEKVVDAVITAISSRPVYLAPVGLVQYPFVEVDHRNLSAWGKSFDWSGIKTNAAPAVPRP